MKRKCCRNRICTPCQQINRIKKEGKGSTLEPYNVRHCDEHCRHKNERKIIPPQTGYIDNRHKMKVL